MAKQSLLSRWKFTDKHYTVGAVHLAYRDIQCNPNDHPHPHGAEWWTYSDAGYKRLRQLASGYWAELTGEGAEKFPWDADTLKDAYVNGLRKKPADANDVLEQQIAQAIEYSNKKVLKNWRVLLYRAKDRSHREKAVVKKKKVLKKKKKKVKRAKSS
jgi:hypothetical protein